MHEVRIHSRFTMMVLIALLAMASPALAGDAERGVSVSGAGFDTGWTVKSGDCLQQVGAPYEKGNKVCIKVKNVCSHAVGVTWSMDTYNFGVHGSGPMSTKKGSVAIEPGKTAEICAPKPTTPGTYCFLFDIKNFDQTKPTDRVTAWLNDITLASMPGGMVPGVFEVGGSGLVSEDILLDVIGQPPGWTMELSTYEVTVGEFPAPVGYMIFVPPEAIDGEEVILTVVGTGRDSGEWLGDANFTVVVGPPEPLAGDLDPGAATIPEIEGDGGDVWNPRPRKSEPPEPPEPVLTFAEDETTGLLVNKVLIFAWDANGPFEMLPQATFEYLGPEGWELIGDQSDRPKDGSLGVAIVAWDTSELAPGDYMVRVTMTNEYGDQGSAERVVTVVKRPVAEAEAMFFGPEVLFDGTASYDPDGVIVDWEWNFGDGTYGSGPTVVHTYDGSQNQYPVTLTVTDAQGYAATSLYTASLDVGALIVVATCGCASMDIQGDGEGPASITFPGHTGGGTWLGPRNTVPTPPPAGGSGYSLSYRFQVVATLVAGSDPALCSTAQWVQRTGKAGTTTDDKKDKDGNTHPHGGDTYAPDNYGGESSVQKNDPKSDPPTITWIDAPGANQKLDSGTIAAGGVSYDAKFFAMVTGPTGTCQCTWEVEMEVAADGSVVKPPKLKNEDCS